MLLVTLAMAFGAVPSESVNAQSVPHLTILQPGGMPGSPVMTGVGRVTNGVSVTWDGPPGAYQLFQKRSLKDASWQAVGAASLLRQATITSLTSNAFFRVSGPTPQYAGAATCAECHAEVLNTVVHTAHFGAFSNAVFVPPRNSPAFNARTATARPQITPPIRSIRPPYRALKWRLPCAGGVIIRSLFLLRQRATIPPTMRNGMPPRINQCWPS